MSRGLSRRFVVHKRQSVNIPLKVEGEHCIMYIYSLQINEK